MSQATTKPKRTGALALAGLLVVATACVLYLAPCFIFQGVYAPNSGMGSSIELRNGTYRIGNGETGSYRISYLQRTVWLERKGWGDLGWPLRLRWGRLYSPNLKGGWVEYRYVQDSS